MLILDEDGAVATLFADRNGAVPLKNPVETDSLGRWTFCAQDGLYTAQVSFGGKLKATVPDIRLEDPSNNLVILSTPDGAGMIGKEGGGTLQDVADAVEALGTTDGAAAVGTSDGGTVQSKLNSLSTAVGGLSNYTLPVATDIVLGGVKVGSGLSISGTGVLSVSYSYTLPIAAAGTLGGVKIGSGLTIDGAGVLSAPYSYTLPIASAGVLGGVKIGTGLSIDASGVLSAPAGAVAKVNNVSPDGSGNITLNTDNIAESGAPTNQWFTSARVRSVVLTGLSLATNAAITATDTVLGALGKLQKQLTDLIAAKDASGGYPGLAGFSINLKNAAGTITSTIASAATVARTWTMPDKSGTVAMTSDIQSPAMVLLGQATVSSAVATIGFPGIFSSAYDKYQVEVERLVSSANGGIAVQLNPSSSDTAEYTPLVPPGSALTSFTGFNFQGTDLQSRSDRETSFTVDVRNVNSSGWKPVGFRGALNNKAISHEGVCNTPSALTGFSILYLSAGGFTSGTVRVYGLKNT